MTLASVVLILILMEIEMVADHPRFLVNKSIGTDSQTEVNGGILRNK